MKISRPTNMKKA